MKLERSNGSSKTELSSEGYIDSPVSRYEQSINRHATGPQELRQCSLGNLLSPLLGYS
jgi:hypothetical protein